MRRCARTSGPSLTGAGEGDEWSPQLRGRDATASLSHDEALVGARCVDPARLIEAQLNERALRCHPLRRVDHRLGAAVRIARVDAVFGDESPRLSRVVGCDLAARFELGDLGEPGLTGHIAIERSFGTDESRSLGGDLTSLVNACQMTAAGSSPAAVLPNELRSRSRRV